MATVSYRLEDLKKAIVGIGYVGENDHMHVLIDCKEVFDEYPDAVATMDIVPPVGESYPKVVNRNGDVVEWLVKNSDVAAEGDGEFQITFTEGEVIKKSVNGRFRVIRSISGSGNAPSGIDDWMTDANEKLAAVEEATQEAEDAAEHQPRINASGYWEIWDAEEGAYVATNVKAQGDKGDPGDPGSPGDPTELIDDTAGEGVTDKTLSANKLAEKFGDVLTDIDGMKPTAQQSDIGKALILKTIDRSGKPTAFEYGEAGGGSVDPSVVEQKVDEWLEENITNPDSPPLDRSLSSGSAAAPADMLGTVNNEIGLFTTTWTADKAIKSNGDITGQTNYSASDYITLYGSQVYVKVYCALTTRAIVAFYDINKTFISCLQRENSDNYEKTTTIPATAYYMRITCKTENISDTFQYKIFGLKELADGVADLVKEKTANTNAIVETNQRIDSLLDNEELVRYEVGYYNTSGNKQDSTIRARSTKLIYLQAGTVCHVDSDYMYRLMRYTADDLTSYMEYYQYDYDSTYHWITGMFVIPVSGYYGVNVSKRDESTVTDANTTGHKLHVLSFSALNKFSENISHFILPYNLVGLKTYINTVAEMEGDLVIPIVTDIHGGYPDTYDIINYIANSGIGDYMFELGDVIQATYPTRDESVSYLRDAFRRMDYTKTNTPIVRLQGNHDTNPLNSVDETKNVTQEIFYAISKARTLKGVHQHAGKAYGYVDVEESKVRIIYLNTSDIFSESTGEALVSGKYTMIQQGQIDWLQNEALDFTDKDDPSEWCVIIMSHDSLSQISSPLFSALFTAFTTGGSASGTYNLTVDEYSFTITLDCDFTQQGAIDVCCEVNGHHHKDMIKQLGTTGIYQVYVACEGQASASYDDDGETVYYQRQRGTTDEHLIDTLVLDRTNRKVYFKRFGIGSDREISY